MPAPVKSHARRLSRSTALVVLTCLLALLGSELSSIEAGSAAVLEVRRAAPCAGEKLPAKPGGGRWVCSFSDEFSGTRINRKKWVVDRTASNGLHVGAACMVDDRRVVSQGKGVLTLSVVDTRRNFRCAAPRKPFDTRLISGSVNTYKHFAQTFGRFEIRARFPKTTAPGLVSSLWLFPVKMNSSIWAGLGDTGEIDIAEHYSQWADRSIPYAHYVPLLPVTPYTSTDCKVAHPERFHTYVLIWTRSQIEITYDGAPCLMMRNWLPVPPLTAPAPFDTPDMVALSTGVGIRGNAPTGATPLPARTQIDYVRVWR